MMHSLSEIEIVDKFTSELDLYYDIFYQYEMRFLQIEMFDLRIYIMPKINRENELLKIE